MKEALHQHQPKHERNPKNHEKSYKSYFRKDSYLNLRILCSIFKAKNGKKDTKMYIVPLIMLCFETYSL